MVRRAMPIASTSWCNQPLVGEAVEKDLVLRLIRERSVSIDEHATYEEMVNGLADLLSDSRGRFSKEVFEQLVTLGAVLYKAGLSQYRARGEIASLMKKSITERAGNK